MLKIIKAMLVAKARPFPPAIVKREGGLSIETQRKLIRVAIARATLK